jgi:regulator of nucleoside diphosphate kinase
MHSLIVTQGDLELLNLLGDHPTLRRELARAVVVPADKVPPNVVTMNSRVLYTDRTADVRRSVKLVYPQQADGRERLSVTSPLGTALLGLRVGQDIEWDFPAGDRRRLRVDAIIGRPERNGARPTLDEKLDEALKQTFPASDAFFLL